MTNPDRSGTVSKASDEKPVWAFIAHKPGRFGGVITSECDKKEIRKFCGSFAAEGYSITPVYNREEYNAILATFKD
jgi:hypothetical protein